MYKINLFIFKYHEHVLEFTTAKEAIKYFTKYGYGMQNWTITVDYIDNGNDIISLATFNYITDVQEQMDLYARRIEYNLYKERNEQKPLIQL